MEKGWFRSLVSLAVVFGILGAGWISLCLYCGTSTPLLVVVSRSMEPTLHVGDLIIVKWKDPALIQVGDIIVFHCPLDYNKLIVHRVIEVENRSGKYYFITKGDNNPVSDYGLWGEIPEDLVVGVVIGKVPYVGYVVIFAKTPAGTVVIVAIIVVLIVSSFFEKEEKKEGEASTESPPSLVSPSASR